MNDFNYLGKTKNHLQKSFKKEMNLCKGFVIRTHPT